MTELPRITELEGLADPEALPGPTPVSAPYFDAAAHGELIFQRCVRGHAFLYPRSLCPFCHSAELVWERSTGRGEVVTFAPVYRPPWDDLTRPVPYVVALVRLDEGPQLLSTIERTAPAQVHIGLRVKAVFEAVAEDVGLVRFVPDAARA